jgi:hypothetical protein
MGRLIDWPAKVEIRARAALAGPRAIGAARSESLGGYVQTVAGVFGVWHWNLSIAPMRGEAFRRYRGVVAALHGGANALRVPFFDPDGDHPKPASQAWSGGGLWSSGVAWSTLADWVAIAEAAPLAATEVRLAATDWGLTRGVGDYLGFLPQHFGLYMITEVRAPGTYRIWPPLRKALTTSDYAHLWPIMVMRLANEQSASVERNPDVSDGAAMTLIEVPHDVVVERFNDAAL